MDDSNIVPLHRRARDGRRILPTGEAVDLQSHARQPETRCVQVHLPNELIGRIDELAASETLSRAAWLRRQLCLALREIDRATA
jgi:hypothetical protein